MSVIEASAAGGKWSETAAWVGGVVPGENDDVILGASSGNMTLEVAASCRSIWVKAAYTGTLNLKVVLRVGAATANAEKYAVRFEAGTWTLTMTAARLEVVGSATTPVTIATGGKTLTSLEIEASALSNKYELLEDLNCSSEFKLKRGEVATNNHNITCAKMEARSEAACKLFAGSSTFKLTGTGIVLTAEKGFLVAGKSTFEITDTSAAFHGFRGEGSVFYKVVVACDRMEFESAVGDTFTILELNTRGKSTEGTKFHEGATFTIRELFTTNATSAEKIKILSTVAGKAFKLSKVNGGVSVDGVELKDSTAEGGALWYAGTHSTNVSGNSGWKFEAAPPIGLVVPYDSFTRHGDTGEESLFGLWAKVQGTTSAGTVTPGNHYRAGEHSANAYGMYFALGVPESVQAVAVRVKRLQELTERPLQLWACLSNPGSASINGYRVRFFEESAKKYNVKIEKVTAGTYSELSSTTALTIEAEDHIGLSVEGGKVAAWRKKGAEAGWELLHEVADSAYTSGYVGVGSDGNIAELIEFRCGKIATPAKPGVVNVLDTFQRAGENPINNGGKWLAQKDEAKTKVSGRVVSEAYSSAESFGVPSNNYWTPTEFTNPFVALEDKVVAGLAERAFHLWLCMTLSAEKVVSGYKVIFEYANGGTELKSIKIFRYTGEVGTEIGSLTEPPLAETLWKYAVSLTEGKIVIWCKMSAASEWVPLKSFTESTYSKGYVGIGDNGSTAAQINFEAASGEAVGPKAVTATVAMRAGARTTQTSTAPNNAAVALRAGARVATTVLEPFPVTSVLDSFERAAETPLDSTLKTGNWSALGWASAIGRIYSTTFGWVPKEETGTDGAAWVSPFASPALCEEFWTEPQGAATEHFLRLWCCIGNPASASRNGYALLVQFVAGSGNKFTISLEKWVAGTLTTLATTEVALPEVWRRIGITVRSGKVKAWLSSDATIANLAVLLSASDATFTEGYVGIEGARPAIYGNKQFRAGSSGPATAVTKLRTGARIRTTSEGGKGVVTGNPVSMLL